MAITTLDGVIAGMRPPEDIYKVGTAPEAAGVHFSYWLTAGRPGTATAYDTDAAGVALVAPITGQIPFINPASGNSYLARFQISATRIGTYILADRLWHGGAIAETTTTAQTINSVAFPARCVPATGTAPDVNGGNVMVGIEVSVATTNAGAVTNTTMGYTNQAGENAKTATIPSFPATAVAGTIVPFALQAGDTGVKSIQTLTLGTSYGGGTIHLVAYRPLARVSIPLVNTGSEVDAITSGFVRLYDGSVPFLLWVADATTLSTVWGQVIYTQG